MQLGEFYKQLYENVRSIVFKENIFLVGKIIQDII